MTIQQKESLQRDPWLVRGVRNAMAIFMLAVLTWSLVMSGIARMSPVLSYVQCFLLALTLVYLLTPLAKSFSFWFGVLDMPEARKIHVCPVPLLGGAPIAFAYLLALYYTFAYSREMKAILIACTLIESVGLVDDIAGVSAAKRLILQMCAVALLITGGVRMTFLPDTWWGDFGEIAMTAVWVIGIINTFNFLDGLDGLAAGLGVVSSFGFMLAGIVTGQNALTLMALPLCGACLAFLRFNFSPASIFLGDGGSTFIGFILAALGIIGTWGTDGALRSLMVPVLILSVPIYDVIFITIYRIRNNKIHNVREWLEYTGKDHIHHRLLHLGLDDARTALFIYAINLITAISGVLATDVRFVELILLCVATFTLFCLITILMEVGGWSEKAARKEQAASSGGLRTGLNSVG